ncbi:MAG TPA: hydrogenase maturation nickel metallochaperone HypA, partial [Phycisphaerae bacterium]|nr:hydrogenase maturation nickel metallochaperone HypA [Phycisphaerae bacterium]
MHELSIAEALLDQVRRHLPPGSRVLTIRVEAGARRCIEEQALNLAWEALTQDTDLANSRLELATLPWTLRCNTC